VLNLDALTLLHLLPLVALALPLAAFAFVGLWTLAAPRGPSEATTASAVALAFGGSLLATLALAVGMAATGTDHLDVRLGAWFGTPDGYTFPLALLVDRLTLPFMALTAGLLGLVGAFSSRYLHRERGYTRFFLLLLLFAAGLLLLTMAGTIDLLFAGWELVGVTSALLIGFFQERRAPLRNALRAFATYRVCDVGLLTAAVLLHHHAHTAVLADVFTGAAWPAATSAVEAPAATAIALCCVFAALGKSAQVPFSGWLPRAMEGPTPSSAIFYGALSIHAGAYLLLRMGPLLDRSPLASGALVAIGVASALHGTFVGRAQSDVKSALAYASMTQVGLIMAEIGLGLRLVPLAHLVGHACVRTLQLLRAPSAVQDHGALEAAWGGPLPPTGAHLERLLPAGARRWLYRLALERGQHDAALERLLVRPVLALSIGLDRLERAWTDLLGGRRPPPSPAPSPSPGAAPPCAPAGAEEVRA
jgi:NADH:ubiquinone oxidoreductase subunit 5 (subunit L)/multisubunit Na+/H+ antiporter MnhA subunit